MIKPKYGECLDCTDGILRPLIAKRCQSHYWQYRNSITKKVKDLDIEKTIKQPNPTTNLVLWYAEIMKREEPICWECHKKINKYDTTAWHGSIAHILPKSIFPSIKSHPMNYLILGMYCGCHGQFDSNWLFASRMKVIGVAKVRFNEFKDSISSAELRRIPEIFLT